MASSAPRSQPAAARPPVLVVALLLLLAAAVAIWWPKASGPVGGGPTAQAIAPPSATVSETTTPVATTVPRLVSPGTNRAAASPAAGPTTAPAPPTTAAPTTAAARVGPVSCQPDLGADQAPDAAYGFECTQGDAPISWPTDRLRLYAAGLTTVQGLALSVALTEFQAESHFEVSRVDAPAAADVVLTRAGLPNDENGYTTVHYSCAPSCTYDHADVQLSTTAPLLESLWVATILHELGHVAGLSHVARKAELMYPIISATSLPTYSPGDVAGLRALAAERASAPQP